MDQHTKYAMINNTDGIQIKLLTRRHHFESHSKQNNK